MEVITGILSPGFWSTSSRPGPTPGGHVLTLRGAQSPGGRQTHKEPTTKGASAQAEAPGSGQRAALCPKDRATIQTEDGTCLWKEGGAAPDSGEGVLEAFMEEGAAGPGRNLSG